MAKILVSLEACKNHLDQFFNQEIEKFFYTNGIMNLKDGKKLSKRMVNTWNKVTSK